jgi:SagB-type dehydrogenase family enzyme
MSKLLWVALPLLVAAALLAFQALRRRPLSRHALNVWSSLLLTVYVATTAGLGLFWVANQQLPVFDWHYLFGYMTVLLVALHLVFNFGIAWRYITRRHSPAPLARTAERASAAPGRRRLLGVFGVLLSAGAAYVLGLRQGRSGLRTDEAAQEGTASVPAQAAETGLALVERFHALTGHSRSGVLLRGPAVTWGEPPPPFKHYPGAPRVALPPPGTAVGAAVDLDLAALAAVLWHTAGITQTGGPVRLRASPSSGALFSTELYVAAHTVAGLAPGLWHYDAQAHALARLQDQAPTGAALGAQDDTALRGAAATIVATAVFRRSGHKYRDRTYRYVLADLGHALENLRVAAAARGTRAHFVDRFDESQTAATLGVDESEEGVLALMALSPASLASAAASAARDQTLPRWQAPPARSVQELPLGVTGAMHRATSLRAAGPPAAAPAVPPSTLPPGAIVLPAAQAITRMNVLDVIAKRRSVRRYASTPLALEALSGVLMGMVGRPASLLSPAVRVNLVAHAVAGLPPGAYRYEATRHALLPRRTNIDLRTAARGAALDQDVIGNAAAVFVLSIARDSFAADASGPARGYRHAFLEAGMVGERVYLEAGARGLGSCAVGAFYDNEASALVAIDPAQEWVVHFAALGVAAG